MAEFDEVATELRFDAAVDRRPLGHPLGCGLDVAVKEVDLRSQYVGEACSAFVDVVVAAGAAEQFGPRRPVRRILV